MLKVNQIATPSFALLSYIIQDPQSTECLVIDPGAGIDKHIRTGSMDIKAVINTHLRYSSGTTRTDSAAALTAPKMSAIARPPKTGSGTMIAVPSTIARVVSRIGRKRTAPAWRTASSKDMPWA